MFKAMLELDFKFCIEFSIEIPDRVRKGLKHSVNIYLAILLKLMFKAMLEPYFKFCV